MAEAGSSKPSKEATPAPPPAIAVNDDSDPDFDDLDDVLDQFSASTVANQKQKQHQREQNPQQPAQPTPTASGPGRPDLFEDKDIPHGQLPSESNDDFMARLTSEMQSVMTKMSADPAAEGATPEDVAMMGKELEEFTRKMEAEGVKPEDLLRAILGEETGRRVSDAANDDRDRRDSEAKGEPAGRTNFEDTIRKTMERMETSDSKATEATQQAGSSEEDMLAELLRAMETEGGAEGDGDLSKMFLGMMEQLTQKDMLYEPMKELDDKYPDWMAKNKSKVKLEDARRYSRQQAIVKEIVSKFEEKGYSDDDPKCREYIWERMQKMQAEGAPPDDLISNPFPGMGGMPGLGALGGGEGDDAGCPTQ